MSLRQRRLLRAALILLGVLLGVSLLFLLFRGGLRGPREVIVHVNKRGIPMLWGIPVGTSHVRDLTFRALKWSKVQIGVAVAPSIDPGSPAGTNLLNTLDAVNKAGLLPPPPAAPSSPYE